MTYSTFQGKLPVVNFLEFETKIEIEIEISKNVCLQERNSFTNKQINKWMHLMKGALRPTADKQSVECIVKLCILQIRVHLSTAACSHSKH